MERVKEAGGIYMEAGTVKEERTKTGRKKSQVGDNREGKRGEDREKTSLQYNAVEFRATITALLLPLGILGSQIQPQPISIHLY